MDVKFYRCRACYRVTDEPAVRRIVGTAEFWGNAVRSIEVEECCPTCKGELVPASTCCDCLLVAADLGSERCTDCDVRAEAEEHRAHMAEAAKKRATVFVDFVKSLLIGERV